MRSAFFVSVEVSFRGLPELVMVLSLLNVEMEAISEATRWRGDGRVAMVSSLFVCQSRFLRSQPLDGLGEDGAIYLCNFSGTVAAPELS